MDRTFYVYLWLREDGTPYYVGKGTGKRAIRKGCPGLDRILIQEFPSEADAFAAEIFLIAFYGRKDNGTGILRNRTDGGDGPTGLKHSEETLRRFSELAKERMNRPDVRLRNSALAKARGTAHMHTPEVCRKKSASAIARGMNPEYRAAARTGTLRQWQSPDFRARQSTVRLGKPSEGAHTRWHANRGIQKVGCALCA